MIFDLTIIGAGIVGLSTAFNYSKEFPKSKILVVEKNQMLQFTKREIILVFFILEFITNLIN